MRPEEYINFHGPDWNTLKLYLEQQKQYQLDKLVAADSHDASQKIRGMLLMIKQILALESAANRPQ